MKKIIFKTEFTVNCNDYVSNPGNGKAVPEYELKDGEVCLKVDKHGEVITHNLYNDIQANKDANDYKKLLEMGQDPAVFAAAPVVNDVSEFGSGNDLLTAKALNNVDIDTVLKWYLENKLKNEHSTKNNNVVAGNSGNSGNVSTGDKMINKEVK